MSDVLILFLVCPILGGLPLIAWITRGLTGHRLDRLGTGNVSVSAAFYHGGTWVGMLAVVSEALKGIAAVGLARLLFPHQPVWELIALVALVAGRYWFGRGAGTTNVVWGYVAHDWQTAGLVFIISGISFTILRERKLGRLGVLVLLPLLTALRYPHDGARLLAVIALSLLIAWIYHMIPDDLNLPSQSAQEQSQTMFRFFQGDRALLSLNHPLTAAKAGQKAATLAQLKRLGYPVPAGWVLPPGDDPTPLVERLRPTPEQPLIVRSSAIGEDSESASAAGVYHSFPGITNQNDLAQAIARCQMSYNHPAAVQYRQDRQVPEGGMAVLVQYQIQGVFSGVAFSRDPILRQGNAVVIEALPGTADRIVSGRVTPEPYRVWIDDADLRGSWILSDEQNLELEGTGDVPPRLIQQVAYLTRHLERQFHGIPQDVEWSYDGQQLWLFQCRPITTLTPIWTRKIAAEVIPGLIRPLTWSINQPLTCGVWGELFTLVLGDRARGLDFTATATLHHSSAYFNASLLGQLFRRMGLPPESLEFLTRGAKFSRPPLLSTLRNLPGLFRLLQREWSLEKDFKTDDQRLFSPALTDLTRQSATDLSPVEILGRIDQILAVLKRATYYNILAPLSLALRQTSLKVPDEALDLRSLQEVASLRSLQTLALPYRSLFLQLKQSDRSALETLSQLSALPEGQAIRRQLDQFLEEYGYLSEVGTDIAVPTWKEDPSPVYGLFVQFLQHPPTPESELIPIQNSTAKRVQRRLNIKGRVAILYSQFLAQLRWSFLALEQHWLTAGYLQTAGDIFFLTIHEIRQGVTEADATLQRSLSAWVDLRRSQLEQDRLLTPIPYLVYGNDPPILSPGQGITRASARRLSGIGASPGIAQGKVVVLLNLQNLPAIDRATILVVPYADSGWAPLLARAGGLIAEVGGRLSHGAIVAREYGIPAVMDVHDATHILQDGQQVRIDGQQGVVDIL